MVLRVAIAGAGIGGLCLAQGLRQADVEVAVYERDPSAAIRDQGYRIRIDTNGGAALEQCLPGELFELYLATSNQPGPGHVTVLDEKLKEQYAVEFPAQRHTSVNRQTLRQILLAGLDDVIHFGRTVTGAEQGGDGVRLRFEDGGETTANVVIGADGVNSVLRSHVVPGAELVDTGYRCVYGLRGLGPVLGAFQPIQPFPQVEGVKLDAVDDYLMWCAILTEAVFAGIGDHEPETLHAFVVRKIRKWHPTLREIVGQAEVGANTALRDSLALTKALTAVHRGETDLTAALSGYEHDMREYGFAAMEESLKEMR